MQMRTFWNMFHGAPNFLSRHVLGSLLQSHVIVHFSDFALHARMPSKNYPNLGSRSSKLKTGGFLSRRTDLSKNAQVENMQTVEQKNSCEMPFSPSALLRLPI